MICLLPNCAYLSETTRMLAIHDALRARGADARIATHGGPHERALQAAGVAYDLLEPRMTDERAAEFVRSGPGMVPAGPESPLARRRAARLGGRRGRLVPGERRPRRRHGLDADARSSRPGSPASRS